MVRICKYTQISTKSTASQQNNIKVLLGDDLNAREIKKIGVKESGLPDEFDGYLGPLRCTLSRS